MALLLLRKNRTINLFRKTRGLIVLTDPDYAGKRIRSIIEKISLRQNMHIYQIKRPLIVKGKLE